MLPIESRTTHLCLDTDISPYDVLRSENHFYPWLQRINQFLQNELEDFQFEKLKNRSLQFVYHSIKVDLLVSPYWSAPNEFYYFLQSIRRDREM